MLLVVSSDVLGVAAVARINQDGMQGGPEHLRSALHWCPVRAGRWEAWHRNTERNEYDTLLWQHMLVLPDAGGRSACGDRSIAAVAIVMAKVPQWFPQT